MEVISAEHVSKVYRLGVIGSGTLRDDLLRLWHTRVLKRADPLAKIGEIDHGNRHGDRILALNDVNFSVKEGEVLGIIGRNGAGKSTILKILSRITGPTTGQIKVRGRLSSLLEVGTGFHAELTGRENIYLNASILGMSQREIHNRFEEIVEFAEIGDYIDTPVKRYSSGMYVRLAFAVAAHLETEILVVDEVLAVGDVGFQKKCLGKMGDAANSGRTVLFVSHRMDHISALCSRTLVFDKGRIVHDGETAAGVRRYYAMFEEQQAVTLEHRADREGNGRIRFIDGWVENAAGERVQTVNTGENVKVVLRARNLHGQPISNLKAGVFILAHGEVHVADLGTWESGSPPFSIDKEAFIEIAIPRLPLNAGQYSMHCVIRSHGGAFEIEDMLQHAIPLTVDHGDYHGIGQMTGGMISIAHSAAVRAAG
ncbi:MAG: ABC transporter ATP-binding protein [Alphaproteobacteria bacterium]